MLKILFIGLAILAGNFSYAQNITTSHAVALRGEPKYAAGFKHWDYVNPDAPKGGHLTSGSMATFDNFNRYAQRGTSAPGAEWFFDQITTQSLDEDEVYYCLVCTSISYPDDYSWVSYKLNTDAKFQDGKPLTARDIAFSFNKFMTQGVTQFAKYFDGVTVEVLADDEVKFIIPSKEQEIMLGTASLTIFPEHYYKERDLKQPFNEPPLGSGAYSVDEFKMGQHVVYKRNLDYWAINHPTQIGLLNFDFRRFDIYKDNTVMLEAFKKGEIDRRLESDSKFWATSYSGKNFEADFIKTEEIENKTPRQLKGFIFNTTRTKFSDRRVREAVGLMFDFEWTNKSLFFGADTRSYSYFQNSDYMARQTPVGRELEILSPFKDQLPAEVFTKEFNPPKTDGSGRLRKKTRRALALFKQAGWQLKDQKLVDSEGKPFVFEIMLWRPSDERFVIPFQKNLAIIGIELQIRTVDIPQATNRLRAREYDMLIHNMGGGGVHPSGSLKFSFQKKFVESTYNSSGYTSDLVDLLINKIIEHQKNLDELKAYGMALDRVLLWQHLVIPAWHNRNYRIAYWDKFSRPGKKPRYDLGLDTWWIDTHKVANLPKRNALD